MKSPKSAFSLVELLVVVAIMRRLLKMTFGALIACWVSIPTAKADSLTIESSGVLELTQSKASASSAVGGAGGFVFIKNGGSIGVLTNGLTDVLGLALSVPMTSLPDGGFAGVGDITRVISKCDANGNIDSTFAAPMAPGGGSSLGDAAAQADGKIMVLFGPGTPPRPGYLGSGLFRLNADGTHDETFQFSGTIFGIGLLVQPDQKILVLTARYVQRFMPDGSSDPLFYVAPFDGDCNTFGLQPGGSIIVGGGFSTVDGVRRPLVARLTPNGSVDLSFGPVTNTGIGAIRELMVQSNGDIFVSSGIGVRRYFADGRFDDEFPSINTPAGNGYFGVDRADHLIVNGSNAFVQYSGRRRIRILTTNLAVNLEQSPSLGIAAPWSFIKPIAPNASADYLLQNFPGPGNAFFRLRPAE
jgi:hypothetical protein